MRAGTDGHQHLVGRAGVEVGRVQGGYDDRQDALVVLAGRLGDQLLGPVAEPGDAGVVVAQHHLVDAGRVGHAEQGAEPQPGVVGVVALEVRLDRGRLVEQPPDVGTGEPARHQPERGQRRVAAAHVGVGVEDAVAGLGGRLVERGARVGDDDDVRRRLEVGVAERLLVGALLAVGLDGPAGLAGDDHDGALELVGQGAAYVVGVGGVEHRELHAVGGADDLGGERGAAHAAEHDAGAAAVGEDVAQADDLVDQRPGLLGQPDPGQAAAGLGLGRRCPRAWRPGRRCRRRRRRRRAARRRRRTPARRGSRRTARTRRPRPSLQLVTSTGLPRGSPRRSRAARSRTSRTSRRPPSRGWRSRRRSRSPRRRGPSSPGGRRRSSAGPGRR